METESYIPPSLIQFDVLLLLLSLFSFWSLEYLITSLFIYNRIGLVQDTNEKETSESRSVRRETTKITRGGGERRGDGEPGKERSGPIDFKTKR